jgi:hypothetical protein
MKLNALSTLICAVLFSNCLPYSVIEQPEALTMKGRVLVAAAFANYKITKVIAINTAGRVLGTAVPESGGSYIVWSIPILTEENTNGTFWVELTNKITGKVYYNEGSDERFVSGGHYDLRVNENNLPIKSAADLARIGKDEQFSADERYVLLTDINLSGEWNPIGNNAAEPFSGVFNGRDRTISGITLPSDSAYECLGLFGYVKGNSTAHAQIKNLNLTLSGAELRLSAINEQCIGILAGSIEDTLVEKVSVNGPRQGLKISKTGGGDFYIGGIAGKISGSSSISRSSVLFPLEADTDSSGKGYIGGIAGYSKQAGNGIILLNKCYNTGLVAINNDGQGVYAGGILGYHENISCIKTVSTVEECYARNGVSASGGGAGTVSAGGLIGGATEYGLAGSRSCALMLSVSASAPLMSAGGFSGYKLAGSLDCYQLDGMEIKPASSPFAVNAGAIAQRDIDETLFLKILGWDFRHTWRWDSSTGCPKFMWQ